MSADQPRPGLLLLIAAGALCCSSSWAQRGLAPEIMPARESSLAGSIPTSQLLRRPGGYYTDDAPDEPMGAKMDALIEPVPHIEPLNDQANQAYVVFGRSYKPMTALGSYRRQGSASWYGRKFHGQRTTSGEVYDMFSLTAAHPTLPIPSFARVTNLANQRSIIVRINDRGPFGSGRIMDVSYAAAYRLGFAEEALAQIEVEAIIPSPVLAAATPDPAASPPATTKIEPPARVPLSGGRGGIYLQLGAFASPANAENFSARMRGQLGFLEAPLQVVGRNGLYRIEVGPFKDRGRASRAAQRIRQAVDLKPSVVNR